MKKLKRIWQGYWMFGLLLAGLLLSACATTNAQEPVQVYAGSARSESEIVKLLVPYELKVVRLDGTAIKTPYVPAGQYQLHLLPGEHHIKVMYEEYWGDATAGSMTKSDIFSFKVKATAGDSYVFQHNGPRDLENADGRALASDIKIWLKQQSTGQLTQAVSRRKSGILASVFGQTDSEVKPGQVLAESQAAKAAPATGQSTPVIGPVLSSGDAASAALAEKIVAEQDALERLKFWWKMADDKQRKEFQAWTWGSKANTK